MREQDLAARVAEWLRDLDFEVYSEVLAYAGGPRADIVARRGAVLWAIEVKLRLGFDVLAQARRWRGRAHRVSVAVPRRRGTAARTFAMEAADAAGIGVLEVAGERVVELHRGSLQRRIRPPRLAEEQKGYAAGARGGAAWSPFKETCARVAQAAGEEPGIGVTELVKRIEHHYATPRSARAALLEWGRAGRIPGVVVRGGSKGYPWGFYPEGWSGEIRREVKAPQAEQIGLFGKGQRRR